MTNLNPSEQSSSLLTNSCLYQPDCRIKLPVIKEILIKFLDYDDNDEDEEEVEEEEEVV